MWASLPEIVPQQLKLALVLSRLVAQLRSRPFKTDSIWCMLPAVSQVDERPII
jgi:hypothetical protein